MTDRRDTDPTETLDLLAALQASLDRARASREPQIAHGIVHTVHVTDYGDEPDLDRAYRCASAGFDGQEVVLLSARKVPAGGPYPAGTCYTYVPYAAVYGSEPR